MTSIDVFQRICWYSRLLREKVIASQENRCRIHGETRRTFVLLVILLPPAGRSMRDISISTPYAYILFFARHTDEWQTDIYLEKITDDLPLILSLNQHSLLLSSTHTVWRGRKILFKRMVIDCSRLLSQLTSGTEIHRFPTTARVSTYDRQTTPGNLLGTSTIVYLILHKITTDG